MVLTKSATDSYVAPYVSIYPIEIESIICDSGDYRSTSDVDDDNDLGEI